MASQIDLGAVVPIGKGDWNSSTTYERTNIVRHNSTAWICKVATSTGVEPTESSSDWYLLVKDTSSVTSVNGMIGDVNINSILENPSTNDNSLKIASTSWVKTKVDNAIDGVNTQVTQVDSKASTALQTANTANSKAEEALNKTGLPLGHIYLWPFSTPPDGSIQINGSTYSRELYSDLWALIQEKNWYKPESEWQQIASANGGYCPWYSDGDGSTTFRTPKFAPYQKIALASGDAGKYYEAGLPNITGRIVNDYTYHAFIVGTMSGALSATRVNKQYLNAGSGSNDYSLSSISFNASYSNSIYGNSTTVQPESHDWIICAVAFGTATNVGSVDVANVMSAVGQVQANPNLQGTAHVVESWKSSDGSSWYRKYSDGWIEQGGITSTEATNQLITFPCVFNSKNYNIVASAIVNRSLEDVVISCSFLNKSTNSTTILKRWASSASAGIAGERFMWYACGY